MVVHHPGDARRRRYPEGVGKAPLNNQHKPMLAPWHRAVGGGGGGGGDRKKMCTALIHAAYGATRRADVAHRLPDAAGRVKQKDSAFVDSSMGWSLAGHRFFCS